MLHLKAPMAPAETSASTDPNGYPVSFAVDYLHRLSDTAFAEPGATGCGPDGLLDQVIDAEFGLPRKQRNSFTIELPDVFIAATQAGGRVLPQAYHAALG